MQSSQKRITSEAAAQMQLRIVLFWDAVQADRPTIIGTVPLKEVGSVILQKCAEYKDPVVKCSHGDPFNVTIYREKSENGWFSTNSFEKVGHISSIEFDPICLSGFRSRLPESPHDCAEIRTAKNLDANKIEPEPNAKDDVEDFA